MNLKTYGKGNRHFLCLHGWSGNNTTFAPLQCDGATLWCPDLPATTANDIATQLCGLAKRIPGPLEIIGNCSGGIYGLLVAQRLPVSRIVLIDAFAFWPPYFQLFLHPFWGRIAYTTAFANPVGRWIANRSLARHRTAKTDLTDGFARVDHDAVYKHLQILSSVGPATRFCGIDSDVDVVFGERSFQAVRRSATIWAGIFPSARRHCLRGAGHLPILEATDQLREILMEVPCPVR